MTDQMANTIRDELAVSSGVTESPEVDVSVLIVGYLCKDLLDDCLDGLFKHTQGVEVEVLYTDCSDDGSVQLVLEKYPTVRVIDNSKNLGFGRGNNFLARHAKGKYLLLLNPDTLIKDNSIKALYDFAEANPHAGAWGGITRLPEGDLDPGCQQSQPGLKSAFLLLVGLGFLARGGLQDGATTPSEVPSLSGAFMMLRRDLWQTMGGFDESFFMYCEETDLCLRVKQSGRSVMMTPDASVIHLVGSGASQSPKRMLALTKGGMHLCRKHFGPLHVMAEGLIRWLYSASRYGLGLFGRPIIGQERAAQLRTKHLPILLHPSDWYYGWRTDKTRADKTTEAAS